MRRLLARFARHRLVHFAIGGGILFAVAPPSERDTRVSLRSGYLASLHAAQAHKLGVEGLSHERAVEVDRRAVEDEVLYREAMRLGLDKDDGLVREHLIQKMLLLAEDLGGASREPSDRDLLDYYEQTRERWRLDERVHLVHVFATSRRAAEGLEEAVEAYGATHASGAPPMGEAFARSRDVRGSRRDFAATYGDAFADAVFALAPGTWSAPVESRFGWHLVKVLDHDAGAPASFEQARDRLRLDYAVTKRHEAIARYLREAMRRYEVDVDGMPLGRFEPTLRLALRSAPSEED